ncbi:MAG: MgtC/SapB family protein [Brachymonas sp.]|nr:MgtC/SapB family protein [Brachymonas sp.]
MQETLAQLWTSEFADIPSVAEGLRILLRLLMALVLGAVLGYERESQGQSAGLRTHMLVAMGSALFALLPLHMGVGMADMSRVIQGVMAGVGFLCAGTILKQENAEHLRVKGLTTATGLWLTAAIGMACGLGRGITAIISTLLTVGVMGLIPVLFPHLHESNKKTN